MDGGSSSSLSELIERARALEFALTVLPTATQDYSERVDSQQQSPACEENESVKYFPAPSEGEWIAASLPCPRKNATPIQRRRDEVARALSPIIPGVDGDETVSDEETPPPLPPRPVAIPEGKGQVVPRNERMEKLQALVDFGENISKFAKNLRKKLVKIFHGPFISHFGKERKRRNDELEASSTDDEETTTEGFS
ncbi:hypothetical protein E2P81_ATG03475 [Venturia nashicola]|nr:hypothetical protein E2P81_ATG03475 [Venturia nashicola]